MSFRLAVSALVESIVCQRYCPDAEVLAGGAAQVREGDSPVFPAGESGQSPSCSPATTKVVQFVLGQHARMPDYLRLPLAALTVIFDAWAFPGSGRLFHGLSPERRWRQVLAWKQSRLGFRRDLIRFYESLTIFGWCAEVYESLDS